MIDPTQADVGRAVVYTPPHDRGRPLAAEEGVITSFNKSFVFVRYGTYATPRATKRGDLEWKDGGPKSPEAA